MHFIGEHCSIYLKRGTGFVWSDYFAYGIWASPRTIRAFRSRKCQNSAKLAGVKQPEDTKNDIVYIFFFFSQRKILN